jgi:ubiquinone/menaquinone biosynthesis C-methylase UbiE
MINELVPSAKFIDPQAVLDQLEIRDGMRVADFGCGAGHFSLVAAKKVGKNGMVFAIDVLPEKLETVQSQAKNLGITNIQVKRENLELENGSGLPDKSANWVIIKDMLYQNKNKEGIILEAKRVLVSGGSILIVEWIMEKTSIGPQKKLRVKERDLVEMAQKNGLKAGKKVEAGDFHYGLVLIK